MKRCSLLCLTIVLLLPAFCLAQTDMLGKIDTMYADIARIDDHTFKVTISYTNDEAVLGLSIPLKLDAGDTKVVGDSAVYTGGRVEHFAWKGLRPDTAIQCVTMGMVANMGPTNNILAPGDGRLVTFFVSSLDGSAIEYLKVDTTTTNPSNSLLIVADFVQKMGDKVDTIPVDRQKEREIIPVFVSRQVE